MSDEIAQAATPVTTPQDDFGNIPALVTGGEDIDMDALAQFSDVQTQKQKVQATLTPAQALNPEKVIEDDPSLRKEGGDLDGEDEEELESSSEESDEDEEASEEEVTEVSPDTIVAVSGKDQISIPKDAKITLTVNGKEKAIPVKNILDYASRGDTLQEKASELGRREVKIREAERKARANYQEFQQRLESLLGAAEAGDPQEVVCLFAEMTGRDPNQVFESLIAGTVNNIKELAGLTDKERALHNENRRYKLQQRLATKAAERQQKEQAYAQERAQVEGKLKENGLTWDDWFEAANELAEKVKSGEIQTPQNAHTVADYALRKVHQGKIQQAISSVSKKLEGKDDLFQNISSAVLKAEAITGRPMPVSEVAELVRAARAKYKAKLDESLSRKVDRAKKAGKVPTKPANSKQVSKNQAITLREHRELLYG